MIRRVHFAENIVYFNAISIGGKFGNSEYSIRGVVSGRYAAVVKYPLTTEFPANSPHVKVFVLLPLHLCRKSRRARREAVAFSISGLVSLQSALL